MAISRKGLRALKDGALHVGSVGNIGLDRRSIHAAYRYPARFSPVFARAAIELFSAPGDTVIDPFCGGGTTGLEATLCGRHSFNSDLNPLATFLTSAKGRLYEVDDYASVERWSETCTATPMTDLYDALLEYPIPREYVGGLRRPEYNRIRAALSAWVRSATELDNGSDLSRLCLLRLGQRWLDLRKDPPTLDEFRKGLQEAVDQTIAASLVHQGAVHRRWQGELKTRRFVTEQAAIQDLRHFPALRRRSPALAVFSPPYPGVHILYQRWQVEGRAETTIPFWLAGVEGDTSATIYTLGGRGTAYIDVFIDLFTAGMKSLSELLEPGGHVVQMVGFKEPAKQLPLLLSAMNEAGFRELQYKSIATHDDGRLWRKVSSQKWYNAVLPESTPTSSEVVLIHRLD